MLQEVAPAGRVNITIEVADNGAQVKKELPLRVLICGDFCQQKNYSNSVVQRVTTNSISNLIAHYKPTIKLPDSAGKQQVLKLESLADFKPDNIIQNVPKLRDLYAMRNLLKDLRTNVQDSADLKHKLQELFQDKAKCRELAKTITQDY
jgi:type VI secretion system protein ImpB